MERETSGILLNPSSSHFQPIFVELCIALGAGARGQEKETMEIHRVTWTDNESVHRLPRHAGLPLSLTECTESLRRPPSSVPDRA